MVKPVAGKPFSERSESQRYRGVRKRKWGKWVSEVRLPNSRERIWLGSYDTPEKAARAFDAALFCLRGAGAKFNFPDDPPDIPGSRSLSPPQIQLAASRFANEFEHSSSSSSSLMSTINTPLADCSSSSLSPWLSPSPSPPPLLPSVSDATVTGNIGAPAIDWSFLDTFSASKSGDDNGSDLSSLSLLHDGYDDFSLDFTLPPSPSPSPSPELLNYEENHYNCGELFSPQSFLWNF